MFIISVSNGYSAKTYVYIDFIKGQFEKLKNKISILYVHFFCLSLESKPQGVFLRYLK
jgi:hypothetical protein